MKDSRTSQTVATTVRRQSSKTRLATILTELTAGVQATASLSVFLPLQPVPASRPRVGRWGTYYLPTYKKWIILADKLIEASEITLHGPLFVIARAFIKPARTTKLIFPKPDVDNYAKAPLDIITKADGYWDDDHQIQTLLAGKKYTTAGQQEGSQVDIFEYK